MLASLDAATLATFLIGGILKKDLQLPRQSSLLWQHLGDEDFILAPLPNHLFQRDNSAWVYAGVSINPMTMPARKRETVHSRAIYTFHPMFAAERDAFTLLLRQRRRPARAGHLRGRRHPRHRQRHGHGGAGRAYDRRRASRRSPRAGSPAATVPSTRSSRSSCRKTRAFMHLDTAMTMVDSDAFVTYPYLPRELRSFTLTPDDSPDGLRVEQDDDLWLAVAKALDLRLTVRVLSAVQDQRAAAREQWDDGNNFLAVSPGVIVGYERNTTTNSYLREQRHRGRRGRRQRARPRPRRTPVHDLPDRARPRLTPEGELRVTATC